MNIVERGKRFVQWLHELADRKAWDWRRCPYCGGPDTCKYGTYTRRPWFSDGRREVRVQRHLCHSCKRTYSEHSPLLVRGGGYARKVRRKAIDMWQHSGSSLRRAAEWLRSEMGRQERWLEEEPSERERCHLAASSVHRWPDEAGRRAQESVAGQGKMLREVVESALMYLLAYNRGLVRVAPEWCWRDFRLRLSRGRNQGSEERLERGALVWAIYRNFTPAQWRSERKRKYRRPGKSPLEVAGVPPGRVSYLDALGI